MSRKVGGWADHKEWVILFVIGLIILFTGIIPFTMTLWMVITALITSALVITYVNRVKGGTSVKGKLLAASLTIAFGTVVFGAIIAFIMGALGLPVM